MSNAVNLLLVDDRPENLLALESVLGDLGHNLVKANSGGEALRHVLQQDFAAILLDVQMPTMAGSAREWLPAAMLARASQLRTNTSSCA